LLFNIYVDCVLVELERSKLGCFIAYECHSTLQYADDLVCISCTVSDLKAMFNLCNVLFSELDIPINYNKCHCLRIGIRHKRVCSNIVIDNHVIEWCTETEYLGVCISSANVFKCNWTDTKRKFYCCSNTILGRLGLSDNTTTLLKLIDSTSLQKLIYGAASTSLNKSELKEFTFVYDSVFNKIFKTFDTKIIRSCQFHFGYLSLSYLYDLHRLTFFKETF